MYIFALYKKNKHSMPRQKREKSGTGICHVMQGKESKTCPYDFARNAQYYGWSKIYNRSNGVSESINLRKSISSFLNKLWNFIF